MTGKRSGSLRREQGLRIRNGRVAVPVAKPAVSERAARDDAEAIITCLASKAPRPGSSSRRSYDR